MRPFALAAAPGREARKIDGLELRQQRAEGFRLKIGRDALRKSLVGVLADELRKRRAGN